MVTDILDQDTSAIHRAAREKGLNNVIEVYLDTAPALPSLKFRLHNAKPGQDEEFLAAVKTGLKEVSENGVSSDLFHAVLKETVFLTVLPERRLILGSIFLRRSVNTGAQRIRPDILLFMKTVLIPSFRMRNRIFCADLLEML